MTQRRYDIDWLRVIAIGLLIIYHAAIGFQPWGGLIGFIQNNTSIEWIWYPMAMLNMWRIPILFFVSGMGVYFSMRKRNLIQLILERSQRILIPFVFGLFVIVPIHILIWQQYYYQDLSYRPDQSHLWFLLNIFTYSITLVPLVFLIKKSRLKTWIKKLQKISFQPLLFLVTAGLLTLETAIVKPEPYTMYAYTAHGWLMGFIAFSLGFYMVSLGTEFWNCFKNWKWIYLTIATALYVNRLFDANMGAPYYLNTIETTAWVFTVFGFFYQYANRTHPLLSYLSSAAYPVYIIHMVVQYGISSILFPLEINANIKLFVLTLGALFISMALYHFLIRPVKLIRPLFGLKLNAS